MLAQTLAGAVAETAAEGAGVSQSLGGHMDRDRRTSMQGGVAEVECLSTVIEAVVGVLTAMRPLRRERERLMRRHVSGMADADDLHRYRMTRLRLLMLESANRGVRHPLRAAEVLADRSRLTFDALVDRTDPFPEPQPS